MQINIEYRQKTGFSQFLGKMSGKNVALMYDVNTQPYALAFAAEMEEKGLIEREKSEEKVYRNKIFLTEKGKEIADFVGKRAASVISKVSDSIIKEEEREHLYKMLAGIYKNLREF